ncbi:MAG TPA: DUF2207 domain-containing protein [Quisquiliibacterium sp.]|nr:DUF2207 domain-containing protein [Quisquiliibacterium sp.]
MRLLFAVALALAATFADPARAAEAIERFLSTIEVGADGELLVEESITVRAEGRQIRRGIYRDFPLQFEDAEGNTRQVSFDLLGVTRDGRPEPHFTRVGARGVRIYAGSEATLLEPGVYRYAFRYRTGRQIRHLPQGAELHWNVTGNEWAFPVLSARALVRLPGNAAPVRWTGYTGRFGERGTDFTASLREDGLLEFNTTRPLRPGEGLTLVAEIPSGVVAGPTQAQRIRFAFLDHRRYILGGLGLLVVAAFYLLAWRAVGRDPPKGTIIPRFDPPPGISPALAGYIRDWGWSGSWREFTAAAISLAVKGLLLFDQHDGGLTLKRAGKPAPGPELRPEYHALPPGERALLSWIDGSGGVAVVDSTNGPALAKALQNFKSAIEKENRGRFFRRNLGWFAAGLFLTGVAIGAVLVFGSLREAEIALLVGTTFATLFIGGFAGVVAVQAARSLLTGRTLRVVIPAAVHLAVLVFMGVAFLTQFAGIDDIRSESFRRSLLEGFQQHSFPLVLVAGFAALNGLFYYLLRAPTAAGRPVMDHIEGLELYLRTAETARLDMAGAPQITTERFERLLPYAIALEAERPWSEAFEAAFTRAHPGEDLGTAYRPGWHSGSGFSGRSFGRALAGAVAATQGSFASAMPAPKSSSSGFSGGGGSGGGGGGGGGGGW